MLNRVEAWWAEAFPRTLRQAQDDILSYLVSVKNDYTDAVFTKLFLSTKLLIALTVADEVRPSSGVFIT